MLKHSDDTQPGERPEISRLLERLARESREWAEAETALARIELDELKAQALKAVIFAVVAFAAVICTLLALTEALIAFLAPHVSAGIAALIAVAVFAILAVACAFAAKRAVNWRTESIFFRWLGSRVRSDAP
jgi:uncharacterized membrane protein YqjE